MTNVPRQAPEAIQIQLFDNDLSSPTFIEDLTSTAHGLTFTTKLPGGFGMARFQIPESLSRGWERLINQTFYRVVIRDGLKVVFEGRIEDIGLTAGLTKITAFGYYANLTDVPYTSADNQVWSTTVSDILDTCLQISADRTNLTATDITVDLGGDDSYLDIYPKELIAKLLPFGDSSDNTFDFAIWEDRVPFLSIRNVSTVDYLARLQELSPDSLVEFDLKHRASNIWNSVYGVYDVGGVLTRTAAAGDTDSQTRFNLTRQWVVPQLGTVAQAAAEANRDTYLALHKDIRPSLERAVLGMNVSTPNGVLVPSSWVRAGDVLRLRDVVPATAALDTVSQDALRTFFILETNYNATRRTNSLTLDTPSGRLDAVIASKLS